MLDQWKHGMVQRLFVIYPMISEPADKQPQDQNKEYTMSRPTESSSNENGVSNLQGQMNFARVVGGEQINLELITYPFPSSQLSWRGSNYLFCQKRNI